PKPTRPPARSRRGRQVTSQGNLRAWLPFTSCSRTHSKGVSTSGRRSGLEGGSSDHDLRVQVRVKEGVGMFGQWRKWGSTVAARGRLASLFVVAFSLLLIVLFLAPAASAVTQCTFAGTTATVTIDPGNSAVIGVNTAPTPNEIIFDNDATLAGAAQCGNADVTNTNLIDVNGSTGSQTFVVALSGGAFRSNNDFNIDLGTGTDTLVIVGSGGADAISFASATSIMLGGGTDITLASGSVEAFTVNAGGGNDTVSGASFTTAITINGDAGDDILTGGSGVDTINGGAGNDTISGG